MKSISFGLIVLLGVLAFAVTLAIVIGERLAVEEMAVLMGVLAGAATSIPTSLVIAWIALQVRADTVPAPQPAPRREPVPMTEEAPRIVVVQQPAPATMYPQAAGWNMPVYPAQALYPNIPAPRSPRKFTIIGGAEAEEQPALQVLDAEL
jgi:hypothetical protein